MKNLSQLYKNELLNEIIPFWENHSIDHDHGGFFTCLDATGNVYDTDKFVWLQARQVWMFATLYKKVSPNPKWLSMAKSGGLFLEKHGRDAQGKWYFSLDQQGSPLVRPYNIFSDCFAAMAFAALFEITQEKKFAQIAVDTFHGILSRKDNPKMSYNKIYPGTRDLQNFALPMILSNLSLELSSLISRDLVNQVNQDVIDCIMNDFYQRDTGLVLENVGLDGSFVDSFEGRLLNPGHAIEAMWFVMNIGFKSNNHKLVQSAEEILFNQLDHGWDTKYGGIFYFMDCKGYPPQQLEHDQKLWWVHLETLVALAKIYAFNKSPKAKTWFLKVHDYTWNHFRDPINGGEWYGYLNRKGELSVPLKGGKWKGCFHVPRALLEIWKTLEKIIE